MREFPSAQWLTDPVVLFVWTLLALEQIWRLNVMCHVCPVGSLWVGRQSSVHQRFRMFAQWVILTTLTFRKGVRLDCVQEGLDQSCHESHNGVLPCWVLVLGLGEALWGSGSWTSSAWRGSLSQAEPQQQHSYTGPEHCSAALPPPTPHTLT